MGNPHASEKLQGADCQGRASNWQDSVDTRRDITFKKWFHVECFALAGGGCPRTAKTAEEFESNHLDVAAIKEDLGDTLYAKFKEQLAASFDMKAQNIKKRGAEPVQPGRLQRRRSRRLRRCPMEAPLT